MHLAVIILHAYWGRSGGLALRRSEYGNCFRKVGDDISASLRPVNVFVCPISDWIFSHREDSAGQNIEAGSTVERAKEVGRNLPKAMVHEAVRWRGMHDTPLEGGEPGNC